MTRFIFGAGPQGRVILDILRARNEGHIVRFLDDNPQLAGLEVNGVPVVGGLDRLESSADRVAVIVALGNPLARLAVAQRAQVRGIRSFNAVHPSAVIMASATIGVGNMIAAGVVINSNAHVADHVIVNTGAVLEHDAFVAEGATICPGVHVGGRVCLERGAFIGTGAILLPRVTIGAGAVVAAGAVVTRSVESSVLVKGSPARSVETINDQFDWRRVL